MSYEINQKLLKNKKHLSIDEKERIIDGFNEITLNDKILCIIFHSNALKFTTDTWGIHEAFYRMKKRFPEEFDDVFFRLNNFHYSEKIEETFQILSMCNAFYTTSPDFRHYHVTRKTMDKIKDEIIPKVPKSFLEKLDELIIEFLPLIEN